MITGEGEVMSVGASPGALTAVKCYAWGLWKVDLTTAQGWGSKYRSSLYH